MNEIEHGNLIVRWWLEMRPDRPWLPARLQLMEQRRYTDGTWSRQCPAKSHSDGSGLLDALLGTDALDAAIREVCAVEGCKIEDLASAAMDCVIRLHARARADRARKALAADGEDCFIRFGKLPANGRSWNHRDGNAEVGVSCYRARKAGRKIFIFLAGNDQISAEFIIGTKPMYLVRGMEIGTGADGEPLLADCTAKKCSLPYEIIRS